MSITFQDLLSGFSDEVFVGRKEQLSLFENALLSPSPPYLILGVSGQGGVGKTTLLEQFRRVASRHDVLTAYVNESQTTVPNVLAYFSRQLGEVGHKFENFEKHYHRYLELKDLVESDPQAPKGILDFALRSAARISMRSLNRVPLAGEAIDVLFTPEAENIVADQVSAIATYIGQKFSKEDDKTLLLETDQQLTRYFLTDLNRFAKDQRIILIFDTYEKTALYLDSWFRNLLKGEFGVFSGRISFVIAGRHPLGQSWTPFKKAIQQIELNEFSESEVREYLENFNIRDEAEIVELSKLSNHLPVLLALLTTVSGNKPQTEISESAVERFLQGSTAEQREVALVSSVPRFFNQDILNAVLETKNIGLSFLWLTGSHFVSSSLGGWIYHDIVRGQLLRYFRLRSFKSFSEKHGLLVDFYNSLLEELEIPEEKRQENEIWQNYKLESLYHSLCQNPPKNLATALNGFVASGKIGRTYLRRWVEAIKQAGEDTQVKEIQRWGELLSEGFEAVNSEKKQYQLVIEMYSSLLETDVLEIQWQADVLKRRSYYYNIVGQVSKALDDSKAAINLEPEKAEHWMVQAILYQSIKQHDEALAAVSEAIRLKPEDELYARMKLFFLLQKGDVEKALEELSEIAANPDLSSLKFPQNLDEASLSEDHIMNLIQNMGFDSRLIENYATILQSTLINNPKKASSILKHDLGTFQQISSEIDLSMINKFLQIMGVESESAKKVVNLVTNSRDDLIGYSQNTEKFLQAEIERLIGQFDQAIKIYSEIIKFEGKSPIVFLSRGEAYRMIKQYDKAIGDFSEAIELDPGYVICWARRGETHLLAGRYPEALNDFNQALIIAPNRDWCHYQVGLVYQIKNEYNQAKTKFIDAIDIATRVYDSDSQNWSNTINLIFYYLATNEPDRVEYLCDQVISSDISSYIIAEATHLLELFIRLFPNHKQAKNLLARLKEYLLNQKGKYDEE